MTYWLAHRTITPHPKEGEPARFTPLAKSIVYQVLNALAYLHHPSRRITDRGIKPENILLAKEGCLELIDFGVAYPPLSSASSLTLLPEKEGHLYFEVSTRQLSYLPPLTPYWDARTQRLLTPWDRCASSPSNFFSPSGQPPHCNTERHLPTAFAWSRENGERVLLWWWNALLLRRWR